MDAVEDTVSLARDNGCSCRVHLFGKAGNAKREYAAAAIILRLSHSLSQSQTNIKLLESVQRRAARWTMAWADATIHQVSLPC